MRAYRLFWQLLLPFLILTVAALLALALVGTSATRRFHLHQTWDTLESRARLIAPDIETLLSASDYSAIDRFCKQRGRAAGIRVTVVLPAGRVVGDSHEQPDRMDNHGHRPEILSALAGGAGHSQRFSFTLDRYMAYAAIPVSYVDPVRGKQPPAIVRTAVSLQELTSELLTVYVQLTIGLLVVAGLAAGLAWWLAARISRPLEELRRGAEQLTVGTLDEVLPEHGSREVIDLARTLNHMASQLDQRIRQATSERNEREAILSSMVEGVLAVDNDRNILHMNRSAARLLGVEAESCQGRNLHELIRTPQLHDLVEAVFTHQESIADELAIFSDQERTLRFQGAVLRAGAGTTIGALVVLYDVTQIKRLENVRSEFVANVSHELKTPITSIKGYVETLLDGSIHADQDVQRFLRIIASQADRLNAIIDDLLALSRVEQKAERSEIPLTDEPIKPVLEAAVESSDAQIREHKVTVQLTCDDHIHTRINTFLLGQAVTNLIDNACKYSPDGATIWIEAEESAEEIVIRVRDQGCGIEEQHLPRLFERFYRVDKSRSRKLGGTGLGLAIVKHIAQAHHGHVHVESSPGTGSQFSIVLPPHHKTRTPSDLSGVS